MDNLGRNFLAGFHHFLSKFWIAHEYAHYFAQVLLICELADLKIFNSVRHRQSANHSMQIYERVMHMQCKPQPIRLCAGYHSNLKFKIKIINAVEASKIIANCKN